MKIVKIGLAIVLVAVLGLAIAGIVLDEPRPKGTAGPAADAVADKVARAAGVDAWNTRVGAISWRFGDRRDHLWDRQRGFAQVTWEDVEVLLDLGSDDAIVKQGGAVVTGEAAAPLRREAFEAWTNDSFWLNPLAKLHDEGTTRSLVSLDGGKTGLLVGYEHGGVTPGDAYLWMLGPDHLPTAWKMWADMVPIGGVEVSWEGWIDVLGAKVSTRHEGPFTLVIENVKADASAVALAGGEDPFAELTGAAKPASQPAAGPGSQPGSQPGSMPSADPASRPASQPAGAAEPDPAEAPEPEHAPAEEL